MARIPAPAYDLVVKLAVSLAIDAVKAAGRRLRELTVGDEQEKALERVFDEAFVSCFVS